MKLLSKLFGSTAREETPAEMPSIKSNSEPNASEAKAASSIPAPAPMRKPTAAAPVTPAVDQSMDDVAPSQDDVSDAAPEVDTAETDTVVDAVIDRSGSGASGGLNIWDIDVDDAEDDTPPEDEKTSAPGALQPQSARNAAASRARRNRTRLIGFDKSDGEVVDLFDAQPQAASTERVQFPVGWLLVVEGPGRGHCFALLAGMSQIGRGTDQTVQLDFGDTAISRNNHAAVVFDEEASTFMLGHGGKANIVRLNGKPVISNETLNDGDQIKIGDTTLQLKTLCGEDFNWSADDSGGEEHEDVAIA